VASFVRRTRAFLVAGAVLALAAGAAHASFARAAPAVDQQAWARTGPLGPTDPQEGRIYVSTAGGQEQARAFIHVDVAGLDAAEIAGSDVALAPASDGMMADQASLIACSLVSPLTKSGELSEPPEPDCSLRTDIRRGDDGRWTVPLEIFAGKWSAGDNPGMAVIADPEAEPSVFTLSFDTTKTGLAAPSNGAPVSDEPVDGVVDAAPARDAEPSATPAEFDLGPAPDADVPSADPAPEPKDVDATATGSSARPALIDNAVRKAAHPSALLVVVPALLAGGVVLMRARRPRRGPPATVVTTSASVWKAGAWLLLPVALMTLGEATVYKVGLIAIAFIAAIGLHLLVNWTGELSLAHAGFIGVPAFTVAQLSSNTGLSPILWLPVAVVVGVALGSVVGVAALRSRGLQVALVTLAFGIAIGQFLFFRSWLVGPPGGLQIPVPSLFGLEIDTNRALVPVLSVAVLLAVLAAKSTMRSTIGRALVLVRSDPDAAAAAGVPVARYRALAYAFAGGFAGMAGWAYVVWVQQITAKAFPLQLGFTYLVIAALAGPGGLAGVLVAAAVIQGGALFSILPHTVSLYLAPIALIINVTRYQEGFNGVLRATRTALGSKIGVTMRKGTVELRLLVVAGTVAVVGGFSAIALAWYHMGNTDAVWVQNQELVSGGVAGLGLIVLGAALLLRDALLVRTEPSIHRPDDSAAVEMVTPSREVVAANGPKRRARAHAAETSTPPRRRRAPLSAR